MAKELYNGIYSSHKVVFIERIERNLQFYLKNKIEFLKKVNQEIFCIVGKENLCEVLYELKNNPDLEVKILNSINLFKSENNNFLLLNLSSASNNFSMIIKVLLTFGADKSAEDEYNELILSIKNVFDSAELFRKKTILKGQQFDLALNAQILNGLDCFDLYVISDYEKVEKVFVDTQISAVVSHDFFMNANLTKTLSYISRFDFNAGIFPELCFCLALEELMQLKLPKRVQYIRMLLAELFRISSHLHFIANISRVLGAELVYNQSLMERERVLRIIEFITGARVHPNFIRVGGVKKDLNYEKIKNIRDNLPLIFKRVLKLELLLLDNPIITSKLKNVGVIDNNTAMELGVTGPNLRACGIKYDIRKNRNLLFYKDISFLINSGKYGDCLDRVQVRFREIYQSLKIIHQLISNMPDERIKKLINLDDLYFPYSVMVSSVECPHGVLKIYLEIRDNKILNMILMGPSKNSLNAIEKIIPGNKTEDIELILSSLDLSGGEIIS